MSTLISRQEAKARGRATTAASEQLRRMLEDSLRLDDAVERLELLEHATDMLLRTLDHEIGRTIRDVDARIYQLSTGNPQPLTKYAVIETDYDTVCEKYLHRRLCTKR